MVKLDLRLDVSYDSDAIYDAIVALLPISRDEIRSCHIIRRTLCTTDRSDIYYKATVAIEVSDEREAGLLKMRKRVSPYTEPRLELREVDFDLRPIVVGAGPAGLFAALALARAGARPILLERGLDVDERNRRVSTFRTLGILDTECNVQYGEGGAGTYSDGKLKVGSMDKYKMEILTTFAELGADESIVYTVGAHVGTDVLSGIVKKIRERIISLGGEVRFGTRLVGIDLKDSRVVGCRAESNGSVYNIECDRIVMATGHSARDSFELLNSIGVMLERRGFGIGMRIEHPRRHIDRLIYGDNPPSELGAASYHLVTHLDSGRSVYSFCMCPGGEVVAAASEECGIVTNGMSFHARDGENSNAALLVSVTPEDFGSDSIFAGLDLQRRIERTAYLAAGSDYKAPATSLGAFMTSSRPFLGDVLPSYALGTREVAPEEYLPRFITDSIRAAIPDFDAWLPGYAMSSAALTGPETRSTSPIRVIRDERTLGVLAIEGLWCAGEGSGYSGGIVSSARDGLIIAERIING